MQLSGRPPKRQQTPQDSYTVAVRSPPAATLQLTKSMTTEDALTQLAIFVKEKNLELRGIQLNHGGQSHDYSRTKKAANSEAQKIESSVPQGRTGLTITFVGSASTEVIREIQEAADKTARRIELCETIIGTSLPMRKLKEVVELAAGCDSTVFISGESGTGKELVAQTIHNLSHRADKPFVSINCGALSEALLESELFGYVKGAFTGATASKKGLFEAAHQGTIFLDEFGEMSPAMQIKLLRVLQERRVRPVGATSAEVCVDIRIIVATNKDLEHEINEGRFRQDLYYRVNVLALEMPPLRDRRADIPALTRHLLSSVHQRAGLKSPAAIDPTAVFLLSEHPWRGNVRELENKLERLSIIAGKDSIITAQQVRDVLGTPGLLTNAGNAEQPRKSAVWTHCVDRVKKERMEAALALTGGNQAQAAILLGMKRSAFHRLHKRVQQRTMTSC